MLKIKPKSHEFKPAPVISVEGEGKDQKKIYGEPYGFTLLIRGLNTPDLLKLQSIIDSDPAKQNQSAYAELSHIIGKTLEGWDGLTKERIEELMYAEIEDVPETHVIKQASLKVTKENKADAVDVIALMCENNFQFYGSLTNEIINLSLKKKETQSSSV